MTHTRTQTYWRLRVHGIYCDSFDFQVYWGDAIIVVPVGNWAAAKIHSNSTSHKSIMSLAFRRCHVHRAGVANWLSPKEVQEMTVNTIHSVQYVRHFDWSISKYFSLRFEFRLRHGNTTDVCAARTIGLGRSMCAHDLQLQESVHVLLSRRSVQCGHHHHHTSSSSLFCHVRIAGDDDLVQQ